MCMFQQPDSVAEPATGATALVAAALGACLVFGSTAAVSGTCASDCLLCACDQMAALHGTPAFVDASLWGSLVRHQCTPASTQRSNCVLR
jgi:hypothetical protein